MADEQTNAAQVEEKRLGNADTGNVSAPADGRAGFQPRRYECRDEEGLQALKEYRFRG